MPSSITPNGEQTVSESDEEMTPEQSEAQMRRALETLSNHGPAKNSSGPAPHFNRSSGQKQPGYSPGYPSPSARKHRFVQDGEVQVVHLPLVKDKPQERPQDRQRETAPPPGMRPDRLLQDAQAAIRSMQTKLAHAEIALREAVQRANVQAEAVSAARAELQQARAETRAAEQARMSLEHRLTVQRETLDAEIAQLRAELEAARSAASAPREASPSEALAAFFRVPEVVPPAAPEPEPEPVWAIAAPKPAEPPAKLRAKPGPKPRQPRAAAPEAETEPEPVKWWLTTKPKPVRAKRADKKA